MKAPPVTISIDDSDSLAFPFYPDPDYPVDSHRISKLRWVTPFVVISATSSVFGQVKIFRYDFRLLY